MMDDSKVLNSKKAAEITGGDRELFCQLLEIFHDTAPLQLKRIKLALLNNDMKELIASAHDIKSSAMSIGADLLHEKALELEIIAKNRADTKAIILIDDIEEQQMAIDEKYRSLSWEVDFKEVL